MNFVCMDPRHGDHNSGLINVKQGAQGKRNGSFS